MANKLNKPAENEPVVKALHVAMGFATFAIMAVVFLKPVSDVLANKIGERLAARSTASSEVDRTTTGSISTPKSGVSNKKRQNRLYTVRRSVLQKSRENPCSIARDGSRSGDC